jgi:hypothetical protein
MMIIIHPLNIHAQIVILNLKQIIKETPMINFVHKDVQVFLDQHKDILLFLAKENHDASAHG